MDWHQLNTATTGNVQLGPFAVDSSNGNEGSYSMGCYLTPNDKVYHIMVNESNAAAGSLAGHAGSGPPLLIALERTDVRRRTVAGYLLLTLMPPARARRGRESPIVHLTRVRRPRRDRERDLPDRSMLRRNAQSVNENV